MSGSRVTHLALRALEASISNGVTIILCLGIFMRAGLTLSTWQDPKNPCSNSTRQWSSLGRSHLLRHATGSLTLGRIPNHVPSTGLLCCTPNQGITSPGMPLDRDPVTHTCSNTVFWATDTCHDELTLVQAPGSTSSIRT